jgi:hypothetical protein
MRLGAALDKVNLGHGPEFIDHQIVDVGQVPGAEAQVFGLSGLHVEQAPISENDEPLMKVQTRIQVGEEARHDSLSGHESLLGVLEEALGMGGCQ